MTGQGETGGDDGNRRAREQQATTTHLPLSARDCDLLGSPSRLSSMLEAASAAFLAPWAASTSGRLGIGPLAPPPDTPLL